jgi:sodium pump decarboxylase gamma subunit
MLYDALVLTVLGMGTVLVVLSVICLMILLMGKLLTPKPLPALPELPSVSSLLPAAPAAQAEDDEEVTAAIAAVLAILEAESAGSARPKYRALPAGSLSGAWANAGRLENTQCFS